jgi:ATP-binding protein involved in chromosome partitioning
MWFKPARNLPDADTLRAQVASALTGAPVNLETFDASDAANPLVILSCTPDTAPFAEPVRAQIEGVLRAGGIKHPRVILTAEAQSPPASTSPSPATPAAPILAAGVGHVIAVASGKGGVGKSTVAANLAVALSTLGLRVGLLDADIYGPSVPLLMGRTGDKPETKDGKLAPIIAHGLKTMSIGFLVDTDAPMIWRGPMVQSAIVQMLRDVDWSGTDVLVVDMPPGTGDAQLTFAQKLPLSGAVIVSTPQDIALIDARKGLEMFRKTNVPIIGIIENMSTFCCPNCGHVTDIFGSGGARAVAEKLGVPFLGALPLDAAIRSHSDAGTPITLADPAHAASGVYTDIARMVQVAVNAPQKPAPTIRFVD